MKDPVFKVKPGMHVEIELVDRSGEGERMTFDLVPDSAADFARGFLGESTPLAKAILGALPGSVIPYHMEDIQAVRIHVVTPTTAGPLEDAAARRKETLEKALQDAERTNAMIFASSFSGKWGDYDPDGIEKWKEDDADKPKE